ncbi:MAG: hypothetical protein HY722_14875 [Planctomycetes bacterium]|nr:hypothetical protein [Planctomycetota bacterium]
MKAPVSMAWSLALAFAVAVAFAFAVPAASEEGPEEQGARPAPPAGEAPRLSKEALRMKLRLEEAQLTLSLARRTLAKARRDYDEASELLAKGIYTSQEVTSAESRHNEAYRAAEQAAIDLERTRLEFFQNASHIAIVSARRGRMADSRKKVTLVLENTSDAGLVRIAQGILGEAVDEEATSALLRIENVYVGLLASGVNVGQPYEVKLDALAWRQRATVEFVLLQDTASVVVSLSYLERNESRNVFLDTEAERDDLTVESSQFSQEGLLGDAVSFDLHLERLADSERSFALEAVGLPPKFRRKFVSKANQATVQRVKFVPGKTSDDLVLQVSVPRELDASELNRPIRFLVLAGDPGTLERAVEALGSGPYEAGLVPGGLDPLGAEELELVPKGVGELEILARNYYERIAGARPVSMPMTLKNPGTLTLHDVRVVLNPAYGWRASASPEKGIRLEPGDEVEVELSFEPAGAEGVGEFEMKVEARSEEGGVEVVAPQRSFRVHVEAEADLMGGALVAGALVLLVVVVSVVSVRLSRR